MIDEDDETMMPRHNTPRLILMITWCTACRGANERRQRRLASGWQNAAPDAQATMTMTMMTSSWLLLCPATASARTSNAWQQQHAASHGQQWRYGDVDDWRMTVAMAMTTVAFPTHRWTMWMLTMIAMNRRVVTVEPQGWKKKTQKKELVVRSCKFKCTSHTSGQYY
jgi:hypothetical protein